MMRTALPHAAGPTRALPAWLRQGVIGLLYWAAFLLVLEPGNILRASQAGHSLAAGDEALRILAASLLGASVTPWVFQLTHRFPVLGPARWRHGLIHAGATVGLTLWLILLSCFLAAWVYHGRWLPTLVELREEYTANGLLLVFALLAFVAGLHARRLDNVQTMAGTAAPSPHLAQIPVKHRGRTHLINVADIDWIEAQGNYVALHVGGASHLVRESLSALERQVDGERFVRIHRGAIVALARIRSLKPIANGDAMLEMTNSAEVRVSRSYRKGLAARWVDGKSAGSP